jgi:hypothetical protein
MPTGVSMKIWKAVFVAACVVILAGCNQTSRDTPGTPTQPRALTQSWAKPGTTRAERIADFEDCYIDLAREVPGAIGASSAGGTYLRRCMEKKGYTPTMMKLCQDPHDTTSEDCAIPPSAILH